MDDDHDYIDNGIVTTPNVRLHTSDRWNQQCFQQVGTHDVPSRFNDYVPLHVHYVSDKTSA